MFETLLKKREKSKYPLSDFLRVAAMLLVIVFTALAIKIGGFFTPNTVGLQMIKSQELTETEIFVDKDGEIEKPSV